MRRLHKTLNSPATALSLQSSSVIEAIAQLAQAENPSAIVIGASREGLLQQAINGNIPRAIAQQTESTILLFRGAL
jgi:CIC family chloride channel protein